VPAYLVRFAKKNWATLTGRSTHLWDSNTRRQSQRSACWPPPPPLSNNLKRLPDFWLKLLSKECTFHPIIFKLVHLLISLKRIFTRWGSFTLTPLKALKHLSKNVFFSKNQVCRNYNVVSIRLFPTGSLSSNPDVEFKKLLSPLVWQKGQHHFKILIKLFLEWASSRDEKNMQACLRRLQKKKKNRSQRNQSGTVWEAGMLISNFAIWHISDIPTLLNLNGFRTKEIWILKHFLCHCHHPWE